MYPAAALSSDKIKIENQVRSLFLLPAFLILSCSNERPAPSKEMISTIQLKRGEIISCGSPAMELGAVHFEITGNDKLQKDFNLGMALLHSFEYDEAEKVFASIIDTRPLCAMAYWGVAMSNFHPLWTPPTIAELEKGSKAIAIAKSIKNKTDRETAYINALSILFDDYQTRDHFNRCERYEKAMENLHTIFPTDKEAAILYALALIASAKPTDKTYSKQRKAGGILTSLYPTEKSHPGIIHYIIHTYDYPEMAESALLFARRYATVAPSSAHALHMPSHIFTRLGLWEECIQSNLQSIEAAKCYAEQAGIKGHWDEELHGTDYLVYAYLQQGQNEKAKQQVAYLNSMTNVSPMNFKVAYAFAAVPSRYALENKDWDAAIKVTLHPAVPWNIFPWQKSIVHFTRLLGAAHLGKAKDAEIELLKIQALRDSLNARKNAYEAAQVNIQATAGEAWILLAKGASEEAIALMNLAANMEDSTEKHPVTPGEVIPARELLADMFLELHTYDEALTAYEAVLLKSPNRLKSLNGAALASTKKGDTNKRDAYLAKITSITGNKEKK